MALLREKLQSGYSSESQNYNQEAVLYMSDSGVSQSDFIHLRCRQASFCFSRLCFEDNTFFVTSRFVATLSC